MQRKGRFSLQLTIKYQGKHYLVAWPFILAPDCNRRRGRFFFPLLSSRALLLLSPSFFSSLHREREKSLLPLSRSFSLLLFFLSLSPSLPHFLPRPRISLSLSLSRDGNFRREERFLFLSSLSFSEIISFFLPLFLLSLSPSPSLPRSSPRRWSSRCPSTAAIARQPFSRPPASSKVSLEEILFLISSNWSRGRNFRDRSGHDRRFQGHSDGDRRSGSRFRRRSAAEGPKIEPGGGEEGRRCLLICFYFLFSKKF